MERWPHITTIAVAVIYAEPPTQLGRESAEMYNHEDLDGEIVSGQDDQWDEPDLLPKTHPTDWSAFGDLARQSKSLAPRAGNCIRPSIRRNVHARCGWICQHCGATDPERLQVDHIVPWSWGGSDDIENLQTLCSSCNSAKRDRFIG